MPTYNYQQPNQSQLYPYSASPYPGTQMYPYYASPYPSTPTASPQQQQSSLLTVFVSSEEEVNMYPVAAGVTVLLISFNMRKFYLKSTGKNGVPEPLRVFNFDEEAAVSSVQTNNQNEIHFVTKDEFNSLSAKIDSLVEKLGGE